MKLISILFLLYCFLKTFYYGIYEIKKKNKTGGITVIILAILGLFLPLFCLLYIY